MYEIIRIRLDVFAIEQDCVYQDLDNYDQLAWHVTGRVSGELIAYAIGMYKQRWGLCACMLMDYVDFRPEEQGLGQLLGKVIEDPEACGLRSETELLTWSILDSDAKPAARGLRRKQACVP